MNMRVKFKPREGLDARKLRKRAQSGTFRGLGHAGGAIRLTARRSIKRGKKASPPGSAPYTRKGQLRRAIVYAVAPRKDRVLIGPDYAVVGPSGMAHEFGGRFRGQRYDRRPFMGPALQTNLSRLPRFWGRSVK